MFPTLVKTFGIGPKLTKTSPFTSAAPIGWVTTDGVPTKDVGVKAGVISEEDATAVEMTGQAQPDTADEKGALVVGSEAEKSQTQGYF